MFQIGMDLGGTKIEGVVLDAKGREVFRKRILTQQEEGYEAILKRIQSLYDELAGDLGSEKHTLGIGTPGAVSQKTGFLKNSNTVCLNGKPFYQDLKQLLDRDFAIQNDANCFALAEARLGAGQGKNLVFGVILGTGCGGGIIFDGKIISGIQSIAGEWGHMTLDPNGPDCYCGARGCVETYISGGGAEKMYFKRFQQKLSFPQILEKCRQEDKWVIEFMNFYFRNFGRALANVIHVLDPDIVVMGGGLSQVDELYTRGIEEVRKAIFSDSLETPIVKNQLGDSSGVIGAALMGV